MMKRVWLASLLVAALGWTAGISRAADETPAKDSTPTATPATTPKTTESADSAKVKLKGRLPKFYGKLVDQTQKEQIYKIDSTFDPKIKELKMQMEALIAQRDEQVKAVLTSDQKSKLADMITEDKAKRKEKKAHTAEVKSAAAKTADSKPADPKTTQASVPSAATTPAPAVKTDPPSAPVGK